MLRIADLFNRFFPCFHRSQEFLRPCNLPGFQPRIVVHPVLFRFLQVRVVGRVKIRKIRIFAPGVIFPGHLPVHGRGHFRRHCFRRSLGRLLQEFLQRDRRRAGILCIYIPDKVAGEIHNPDAEPLDASVRVHIRAEGPVRIVCPDIAVPSRDHLIVPPGILRLVQPEGVQEPLFPDRVNLIFAERPGVLFLFEH